MSMDLMGMHLGRRKAIAIVGSAQAVLLASAMIDLVRRPARYGTSIGEVPEHRRFRACTTQNLTEPSAEGDGESHRSSARKRDLRSVSTP